MRWRIWWRPDPVEPKPHPEAARRDLQATREETPKFRALAAELRRMREANHFAESIAQAIREGR